MALKKLLHRLTTPVEVLDEESLRDFCSRKTGVVRIAELQPRDEGTVVGEITSIRILPRPNASPSLEATITDGSGHLIARWTGRRRIAGINPGQRLVISGRGSATGPGGRLVIYNPAYELL